MMSHSRLLLVGSIAGLLAASLVNVGAAAHKADSSAGRKTDTLIMDSAGNDATTWIDNYNPFSPGEKGPGMNYIYDPLIRTDFQHPEVPQKPWLAKSWKFSNGGKTITFQLRKDVKFSDGTPLTAQDVVFTLSVPLTQTSLNPWGGTYTSVRKLGKYTVALTYPTPAYGQLASFGGALIVESKAWAGHDVGTWTNPKPVGTGLLKLASVRPQVGFFDVRQDAWIGKAQIKHVQMRVFSTSTYQLQLLSNQLMWTGAGWSDAQSQFVARDPKHNASYIIPHGGAESLVFDTSKPPFNDVHVRRAIAMSIDQTNFGKLEPLPAGSPCGFAAQRYSNKYLIPACQNGAQRKFNPAGAKSELAAGGWSITGGNLTKGGTSYPVTFAYPVSWQPAAPIYNDIKSQLHDDLGLDVTLITPTGDQYSEAVARGAQAELRFTGGATGITGAYASLGLAADDPSNYAHWDDPQTRQLVAALQRTAPTSVNEIRKIDLQLEQIFYDQVPWITTRGGAWDVQINKTSFTGWPTDPIKAPYLASPYVATDAEMTMLGLRPA